MRWTYLLSRVLIVALVWGFVAFGMDPLLRYSAVQTLQSMTGAKADVGQLKTTFYPPSLSVNGLALASARRPGRNMVEFDEMHIRLEPASLSRRRFVVEEGRMDGLRFDTFRSDDGQLEKSAEPVSEEPSWMSEKLTELGTEWITRLTEQVKAQLDPNVLETYRLGTEVYGKWDERFEDMSTRSRLMKPKVEQLRVQFKKAKEGDTLQQIEQYLQVSQKAEQILIEVQDFREELKSIVPEVREDFQELNAARERDQEKVKHQLSLLKPDPRRISEALLGRTMYRQIQEVLTWVEAAREYQKELSQQVQPPRSAGRDFEFLIREPGPNFLLKNLALSGQMSINSETVPFKAMISDITENPRLLGRPCVMKLAAEGSRPLQMRCTFDATGDIPIAEMLADFRDHNPIPLEAGDPGKAGVQATISDLTWTTELRLIRNEIQGRIQLQSKIGNLSFGADEDVRKEIVEATNDALATVRLLNASVTLGGTLKDPEIDLQSDVGEQIADGVRMAFAKQLNVAKQRLISEVNSYASDQIERLSGRFRGEYDELLTENKDLLEKVSEVRTIVASLQSGKVDAATIVRQVTNSKLIPQKDQEKVQRVMREIDNTLQGRSLPKGLQDKIPQIPAGILQPGGILQLPPTLQAPTGFFPQETQGLLNTPGFLPQSSSLYEPQSHDSAQPLGDFLNSAGSLLNSVPVNKSPTSEESSIVHENESSQTSRIQNTPSVFPQLPNSFRSLLSRPKTAQRPTGAAAP